jgi:hypothetical protein
MLIIQDTCLSGHPSSHSRVWATTPSPRTAIQNVGIRVLIYIGWADVFATPRILFYHFLDGFFVDNWLFLLSAFHVVYYALQTLTLKRN